MPFNKLTSQKEDIILDKGTELTFSGEYDNFYKLPWIESPRFSLKVYKLKTVITLAFIPALRKHDLLVGNFINF